MIGIHWDSLGFVGIERERERERETNRRFCGTFFLVFMGLIEKYG
eukprot:SAG31_NODE_42229_length_272_cov_0.959538_2_plen_44_part_01